LKAREIIRVALDRSGNSRSGTGSLYVPKTAEAADHLSSLVGRETALALVAAMPCVIHCFSRGHELRRLRDARVADMVLMSLYVECIGAVVGI
jgi:hypothetical protein